jgi:phosphoribosylglycinamide formyltransferase-1
MKNITIMASGSGTNAENLIKFFQKREEGEINLLMANRPDAFALVRAENLGVPVQIFSREDIYSTSKVLDELMRFSTDLIVLAGFLWLIPNEILEAYPNRIINIHPALLPKYGGKGMYGSRVHEAVISNGETESGISIHLVNQEYDKGEMLFQTGCNITPGDNPDTLAEKIHALEYKHFPRVVLEYLKRI